MARLVLIGALISLVATIAGCNSGNDSTDTTTSTTVPAAPTTVATATSTTSTTQPTTTSTTTTTTLPEPPHLDVLDPVHGATVTTARYTFTGVTDPGCTVTVGGKYEATVEEDGAWTLDLMLKPGRNSTTFTATHPETGLETTAAIRVYYADAVELRGDGLGAVSFGDDETTTMEILTGLLGPPVTESTCADDVFCTGAGYGWCTYIHHAHWPDTGLSIVIADCVGPDEPPYTPTLIGWSVWGPSTLRTPEGVGPGSSLEEIAAVYGDRLQISYHAMCDDLRVLGFTVARQGEDGPRLHGDLREPPGFTLSEEYTGSFEEFLPFLRADVLATGFEAGIGQSC